MVTIEDRYMREQAVKVRDCSNEIVDALGKHFGDDPGLAFTTMIFLIVRMSNNMGISVDNALEGIRKGFETEALLNAEPPNEFVN